MEKVGIRFSAIGGENQFVDSKTFKEIEDVILYELYQKNLTYNNARKILEMIAERLRFQYLNTVIEKDPKDILINELKQDILRLKEETKILNSKIEKLSKKKNSRLFK